VLDFMISYPVSYCTVRLHMDVNHSHQYFQFEYWKAAKSDFPPNMYCTRTRVGTKKSEQEIGKILQGAK